MKNLMFLLFFSLLVFLPLQAQAPKYMDNASCKECHEKIFEEYQSSAHAQSYFTDALHRKVADAASQTKYECATCHMPMANNLQDLIEGKARPDQNNKTHSDGVSCFFCHTIAYVKQSHSFNVNIMGRQAEGYKPTLYGTLHDPDENDKHSSVTNPVYTTNVCSGCHSHKINENNVTLFHMANAIEDSKSCIKCHMPEIEGGAEKINKKSRRHHASHKFLGIHDETFRATAVALQLAVNKEKLIVTLTNKMDHPLIIQAARAKFLNISIARNKKIIWKNYQNEPSEDTQGYFAYHFKQNGKTIIVPSTATQCTANNLNAKETKSLVYQIPAMQQGDIVTAGLYVQLAKGECQALLDPENERLMQPLLIKQTTYVQP